MLGSSLRRAVQAAALVTELVVVTTLALWAGSSLDTWLGTSPWLLFAGTVLGFTAGLFRLIPALARLQENDDDPPDHPS